MTTRLQEVTETDRDISPTLKFPQEPHKLMRCHIYVYKRLQGTKMVEIEVTQTVAALSTARLLFTESLRHES